MRPEPLRAVAAAPASTAPSSLDQGRGAWLRAHRWSVGTLCALATLGGLLWRRRVVRRRIALEPVSTAWLQQHEYASGQKPED